MMLWSALLVLLCFEWSLAEVRLSDKEASLICVYNGELDTYDMHFRVKLNTDPTGNMRAIENTDYYENPKAFTPVTCTRNYDGATKIYTVDSRVDPNGNNDDNLCGMTEKTVTVGSTTETTYEFLFMHNIDITGDKDLMVSDKDRVYIARCSPSTSVNNVVTSSLTVTNSNLNAQLTPASIPVTMSIYRKLVPSGAYVLVTGPVAAGTTVQIRLQYTRNNPYTAQQHIYGINAFLLEAGSSTAFAENDILVDEDGCAANVVPIPMTKGLKGSLQGNTYVLTSGDLTIWKYDNSNAVYFSVYYGICFEPDTQPCTDLCLDNTGFSNKRRRRNVDDSEEFHSVSAVLRISDDVDVNEGENAGNGQEETTTAENSSSLTTLITLAIVLGVLILLVAVVIVTIAVLLRKTRQDGKHRKFDNISNSSMSYPSK